MGSNARNSLEEQTSFLQLGRRPNDTLAGLQAIINSSPRQRTSSPSGSAVRTAFKEIQLHEDQKKLSPNWQKVEF